jgi:uncharacterized protein
MAQANPYAAAPTDSGAATAAPAPEHGLAWSVALHLIPGLLALAFHVAAAPVVMRWGFPPLFSSILTIPLVIVPWMLGWLAYDAYRTTGRYAPLAVVSYRQAMPARALWGLSLGLVAWGAVAFAVAEATGVSEMIQARLGWLPGWFLNPADFDDIVAMQTPQLVVFLASLLLLAGVVAPAVEELYYRGYLMPGLRRLGVLAPLLSVALFTLYHFESPWESPARFLVVLPMAYAVWMRRSVRLGIVVHVALNTLSALALTVAVIAAR